MTEPGAEAPRGEYLPPTPTATAGNKDREAVRR